MSFKYEKVEDNIYKYRTKTNKVRYRVKITIEYIAFDKSGLANITAARAFIKQATADVLNGEYSQKKPKEYTFGDYWKFYLDKKTTIRGVDGKSDWNLSTAEVTKKYFEWYILPYFKDKLLTDLNRMEFEQFADHLIAEKELRNATADYVLTLIRAMLNHAIEYEVLDRNRILKVKSPISSKPPLNKELYPVDYSKLAEHYATEPIHVRIRFELLSLGLRSAELTGLRYESIEFIPNEQHPQTARLTIDKSRPKDYLKEGKGTKTGNTRIVYANQRIAESLRDYVRWLKGKLKLKSRTLHKSDWLIVDETRLNPIHSKTTYFQLKQVSKKLGIYASPHLLRHYFATHAKLDGIDPRQIADVLGHKSLATTLGYSHGEEESAKRVINNISFL